MAKNTILNPVKNPIPNPMTGRIAEIQFDSGRHFRIDFLPENKLRWTSIRQQDYGVTDVESTHVEILGDGLYAIDWIEKDGLCVSYSVDVNAQFVRSYMSWADSAGPYGGRDFLTHEGPFFFIQDNGERDLRPFTCKQIASAFFAALCAGQDLAQAEKLLADDFSFQSNAARLNKKDFLASVAEKPKSADACSGKILSANVDGNTVFITTEKRGSEVGEIHAFTLNNQLIHSYKRIG